MLKNKLPLRPTYFVRSLGDIDPERFCEQNPRIKLVTLDLDGTVLDYHGSRVPWSHKQRLQRFAELGIRLCVVSNAPSERRSDRVIETAGYIRDFTKTGSMLSAITSRMVDGKGKPDTAMFEKAAADAGVMPEECAHIGDQLLKDVLGAERAAYGATVLVARYGDGDDWRVRYMQRPVEALLRPMMGMPFRLADFPPMPAEV